MEEQGKKPTKPLRDRMPQVSAFVDDLRAVFGAEVIDAQIRRGVQGVPVFWASEGEVELGTRRTERYTAITVDPATGLDIATEVEP